jgi:amino acid transporter
MKEFEDIQQLWLGQQPVKGPDFDQVFKRVTRTKSELSNRFLLQVVGFIIGIATLVIVGITTTFYTWTTYLALLVMIICMLYAFFAQYNSYKAMRSDARMLEQPKEYMAYLREFKQKRNKLNTQHYAVYEACLIAAFALYSYEMYFALPFYIFIGFIVFMVWWFYICHFIFMKRTIRSENEKIERMLEDLARLESQFDDPQ